MDRIDEIDGELHVRDWKTGTVMVGQKISSDLQAPLYIHAIHEKFEKTVKSFHFYYLSENKTRVFDRIDDDNYVCTVNKRQYKINITDAIREVQSIFAQIKKNNFNIPRNTRNLYFTCKTCSYSRDGNCKGADVESWKQYNQGGQANG
jgi:RecB family exonuclease